MRVALPLVAIAIAAAALAVTITAQPTTQQSAQENEKIEAQMAALETATRNRLQSMQARLDQIEEQLAAIEKSVAEIKKSPTKQKTRHPESAQGKAETGGEPAQSHTVGDILKNLDEESKRKLLEELNRLQAEQRLQRTEQFIKQLREEVLNDVSRYGQEKGWDLTKEEQVKRILDEAFKKMQKLFREMAEGRQPRRGFFMTMRQIGEEARSKLLEFMTEEELQDLARQIRGPLGRAIGGRFGPPMRRPPPPAPAPQPPRR